ncbi:ThiF family adenylyltransferase [Salmonella enterica subsp. enterica serovar Infantis]
MRGAQHSVNFRQRRRLRWPANRLSHHRGNKAVTAACGRTMSSLNATAVPPVSSDTVVGVMGTLQALEAIKLLSGIETPSGELRLFDGKTSQWRSLALRRASGCPVCGGQHADSVQ